MSASITAPLAALTTIFTPPCATSWLLTSSKDPSQFPPFPTSGPTSCDPPDWAANLEYKGFQFYSPAICPSGFEVGLGCGITTTRTTEGFPAVRPGETAAYCVPSGQSCTTDLTDFRGGVWGATSNGDTLFTVGPALQIRFQQSDLSILETHPLTPGLTLSSPSSSSSSSAAAAAAAAATAGSSVALSSSSSSSSSSSTTILTTTAVAASLTSAAPSAPNTRNVVVTTTIISAGSPITETLATPTASPSHSSPQTSALGVIQPSTANNNPATAAVIAVVLSALLIVVAVCLYRLFKIRSRHRDQRFWGLAWRRRSGDDGTGVRAVGLGAWVGGRPPDEENPRDDSDNDNSNNNKALPTIPPRELPAELDTGVTASPFEMAGSGKAPGLAACEPVELEADHVLRLSRHASWVSRMLSRVARSSTTDRSRSSSRSRWTQRSPRSSGDWETFIQEKGEGALASELELPSIPSAAYSRPLSMSSSASDGGDKTFGQAGLQHEQHLKVRSFDRLSQGTFGKVMVHGRRLGTSPSRKA